MNLIHGDCLNEMQAIPEGSIDLVLTDPPYGLNYHAPNVKNRPVFTKIANDNAPFIWWVHLAARALKDGGCLISFCRYDSWTPFAYACEIAGLRIRGQIVWDKGHHSKGDCRGAPGIRHELAIFATKGRFIFHGKRPQTVVAVPRIHSSKLQHPTEKPVSLMEHLVEHYCPFFGSVLDPFMGVSPVGVACKRLHRFYTGIELEHTYYSIAEKRLEQE